MSHWDECPACVQLGIDEPGIYDAIVVVARKQGRDTIMVADEFFHRYHDNDHHQEGPTCQAS